MFCLARKKAYSYKDVDIMKIFKAYLQHRFNPLHVYCRLRDYGISSRFAIRVSSAYERFYRVCGLGGVQSSQ